MEDKNKKKPLTQEKRLEIYRAIAQRTTPDDTPSAEVIKRDFHGDEDAYLRKMAGWHNVPL
jgi:hypothetical protein